MESIAQLAADITKTVVNFVVPPPYKIGYYPAIKDAYSELMKKYADTTNIEIKNRLKAIEKFIAAMDKDIENNIEKTVTDTLDTIKANFLDYLKNMSMKKGGDEKAAVIASMPVISNMPVVANRPTYGKEAVFTPEASPAASPETSSFTLTDAKLKAINNAFDDYKSTQVLAYESIKHNNKIIASKANVSDASIRPILLNMPTAYLIKEFPADDSYVIDKEKINKYVFSIIQLYLLHNNTNGINIAEYDEMIKAMKSKDNSVGEFIRDLNSYLRHL